MPDEELPEVEVIEPGNPQTRRLAPAPEGSDDPYARPVSAPPNATFGSQVADPNAPNITQPHIVTEDDPVSKAPWNVPIGTVQGRNNIVVPFDWRPEDSEEEADTEEFDEETPAEDSELRNDNNLL